jgi:hypothetical protein
MGYKLYVIATNVKTGKTKRSATFTIDKDHHPHSNFNNPCKLIFPVFTTPESKK